MLVCACLFLSYSMSINLNVHLCFMVHSMSINKRKKSLSCDYSAVGKKTQTFTPCLVSKAALLSYDKKDQTIL